MLKISTHSSASCFQFHALHILTEQHKVFAPKRSPIDPVKFFSESNILLTVGGGRVSVSYHSLLDTSQLHRYLHSDKNFNFVKLCCHRRHQRPLETSQTQFIHILISDQTPTKPKTVNTFQKVVPWSNGTNLL